MVESAVQNAWFRYLDRARICGANPPERRLCGCLTVSLFNGRVCLQTRALSRQQSRKPSTVGYSVISEAFTQTGPGQDRKSTRLNSSHVAISYAVFCLKK